MSKKKIIGITVSLKIIRSNDAFTIQTEIPIVSVYLSIIIYKQYLIFRIKKEKYNI